MDGRHARLRERPAPGEVPVVATPAEAPPATARRLTTAWAAVLGVGWPLALMIGVALEPAPADPDAPVPIVIELASFALFVALVTTAVTAARRHPLAAWAGIATGLLAMAFSVMCPVSGHHAFGLWWVAQLGVVVAMLGASVAALGPRSLGAD
jgi:hypothetical protein